MLGLTFILLAPSAKARGPEPGSLLVYPFFNSEQAVASVVTVTNACTDTEWGTIFAHFIYIDAETCQETNRTQRLTHNDTFSAIVSAHNPNQAMGYLYVYATMSGRPISFNFLIGQMITFDGIENIQYGINAWSYKAINEFRIGTDVDEDGKRDLDGVEYEQTPDQILIPRFFGQGEAFESELCFVALSGGTQFITTLDFLVYNDMEQAFSTEYTFDCWSKVSLTDISGAFLESFLDNSIDDGDEMVGMNSIETGWIRIDGGVASSTIKTIDDPAFIAVLVERVGVFGASDLPFGIGEQDNGTLLPRSISGDNAD